MAKQILVVVRDEFATGEFARFAGSLTQALRTEFSTFIVRIRVVKQHRERYSVNVHGLWGDLVDARPGMVDAIGKTVERFLSSLGWRNECQPEPEEVEFQEESCTT